MMMTMMNKNTSFLWLLFSLQNYTSLAFSLSHLIYTHSAWLSDRRNEERLKVLEDTLNLASYSSLHATSDVNKSKERYLTKEDVLNAGLRKDVVMKRALIATMSGKYEVQQPWAPHNPTHVNHHHHHHQQQQSHNEDGEAHHESLQPNKKKGNGEVNKLVPLCFRCKSSILSTSHVAWKTSRKVSQLEGVPMRSLFCTGDCFKVYQQVISELNM
jgi:hypothetical protein